MEPPAAPAAPAAATGFEQLPDTALVTILRHVPQGERLEACARVGTAWAAAAAEASADVVLQAGDAPHKVASFEAWLAKHAQHLVSLEARDNSNVGLALPATALVRLQRLEMASMQPLVAAPGSSTSSSSSCSSRQPPLLPALRSVKLCGCAVVANSLALLQRPQLTALELDKVTVAVGLGNDGDAHRQQAVAALLAALPQLSTLCLLDMGLSDAALAPLSAMHQLQDLSLGDDSGHVSPRGVIELCPHLTSLDLALHDGASLTASLPVQWPALLVSLSMCNVGFKPAVLGELTQLEELELSFCRLLPAAHPVAEAEPHDLAAGTAALMSALAQLKRLRSLRLDTAGLVVLDEQQLHAFSALTASSQLSSLVVRAMNKQPLPHGALQHMLPPGRVLPQLRVLELEGQPEPDDDSDDESEDDDEFDAGAWCLEAADVTSISTACPSLERLWLKRVLRATPELAGSLGGLQRLPLRELSVGDTTGWLTNEAASVLARISSLRELGIFGAKRLTDVGLQHFTALRALRWLHARECGLSAEVAPEDSEQPEDESSSDKEDSPAGELLLCTHSEAEVPDVWQQLEAVLENSAEVQRARAEASEQRLVELEAALQAEQQRVVELEAAQHAERQRVVELEGQLSEARQALARRDALRCTSELEELRASLG